MVGRRSSSLFKTSGDGGGCRTPLMLVVSAELPRCSKVRECGPFRSEEEVVEWRRWRLNKSGADLSGSTGCVDNKLVDDETDAKSSRSTTDTKSSQMHDRR